MDQPIDYQFNREALPEPKYAGFWIRLAAMILDGLILFPLSLLSLYNTFTWKSIAIMLVLLFISVIYKPYLEWKKGATWGKMAVGIKVVDASSLGAIDALQAFKRYLPWLITFILSLALNLLMFLSPEFQDLRGFTLDNYIALGELVSEDHPLYWMNNLYSFVFIILVGSLIFDAKKQGLHDKHAETYCVYSKDK